MRTPALVFLWAGLLLASLAGCGDSGGSPGPGVPDPTVEAPDFSLADVNPASATYQVSVSPRQHLGRISAWYFGHAT